MTPTQTTPPASPATPVPTAGPTKRVPSCAEAREIMRRFNASHFNIRDQEHARYSLPADHNHDDDLLMSAFIDKAELALAVVEAAERVVETWSLRLQHGGRNFDPDEMVQLSRACASLTAYARAAGKGDGT